MHVWVPPELESTVGKRIGISQVEGPSELAEPFRKKMLSMPPSDLGRSMKIVDANQLERPQVIQLVSAMEDTHGDLPSNDLARNDLPSDITTTMAAREAGLDYVLRGEVVSKRRGTSAIAKAGFDPDQPVRISWRLFSVHENRPVGGKPVVIDGKTAASRYPDLARSSDPDDALLTALVRESYRLISPSTRATHVHLAIPYGTLGSRQTRQGNELATEGRWGEAELVWQEVVDRHPLQGAAVHNLALSAAAGQDFSRAKKLARKAIRLNPAPLHKKSLVWIEQRQRDYHQAFNLPDPPEGWFVSHSH